MPLDVNSPLSLVRMLSFVRRGNRSLHVIRGVDFLQTFFSLLSEGETATMDDFRKYWKDLTLDPDTAHPELGLYEDCTEATYLEHPPPVPNHPERFDYWEEVLCRQGLEGRCYWELEWKGEQVCVAVSYKGVGRKGGHNDSRFGMNQLSWSLDCSDFGATFWHNNEHTDTKTHPSSRVGVFLDQEAGTLSFYNISDSAALIHRVQTTFTEPLYAGFEFYNHGDHVKLCHLKNLK